MKESAFEKKTTEFFKNLHLTVVKKTFVYESLDSTNTTAKDLARSGAKEGTVVVARIQKKGRGRFSRHWQSPEGGIYLSLILRPKIQPEKTSLLPLVAALAVAKTIDSYSLHATIKWPNDVQVNRKKIAGILLESEVANHTINFVVVGIGINLQVDLACLSSDVQQKSTSMNLEMGRPVDYYDFLKEFFIQFEKIYLMFLGKNPKKIIDAWKKSTDTLGKTVQVQTSAETILGEAYDIDDSGFLLIKTETGELKKITSGDCQYFEEL